MPDEFHSEYHREYVAKLESRQRELEDRDLGREGLLKELRSTIRTLRQALPAYKRVQEPLRYQMTVEDIDEHEQHLAMYQTDFDGVHDEDEIMDRLLYAMSTGDVISSVLRDGPGPAVQAERRQPAIDEMGHYVTPPARPTAAKSSGCLVAGLFLGAGIATAVIAVRTLA